MASQLYFSEHNDPAAGFATPEVDREHTSSQDVIRELIQNSLDAAGGRANVEFRYVDVQVDDLPEIDDYRRAFEAARDEWIARGQGPPGENAMERIGRALERDSVKCLVCVDNGSGISPEALRSLYGTGATTKQDGGRGSVGQGHLTAFAFSDLRYVLYAGRCRSPAGGLNDTFGGHTILATHRVSEGGAQRQNSASGFIVAPSPTNETIRLWDAEQAFEVRSIPQLFDGWLSTETTGGVVLVSAFDPFGDSNTERVRAAAVESAAMNFVVAIRDGELAIRFRDSETAVDEELSTGSHLDAQLGRVQDRTRRTAHTSGPSGEFAFRAWQAVKLGKPLDLSGHGSFEGVRVWFRRLDGADDPARGRVFLFRDGMWLTEACPHLGMRDFDQWEKFDAVVDCRSVGEPRPRFGMLVRRSEGASHYNVAPGEIPDVSERQELQGRLQQLRDLLRSEAGERSDERVHIPQRLALFGSLAPTPPRRPAPRRVLPDPEPDETEELEEMEPDPEEVESSDPPDDSADPDPNPDPPPPGPPGPDGPDRPTPQRSDRVRPGQVNGIRTSTGRLAADGTVMIEWQTSSWHGGEAELRLLIPPGTDEVSEQPQSPRYLRIAAVRVTDSDGVSSEIPLQTPTRAARLIAPPLRAAALVTLADGESIHELDTGLLQAEMVHRAASSRPDGAMT